MRNFIAAATGALILAGGIAVPASAGEPATATEANTDKAKDPNRMICERQEIIGSRLGSKRVCKTAAEWKAEKDANRQMIDRSQTQRVTTGG